MGLDRFIDVPCPVTYEPVTMPPLLSWAVPGARPIVMYDYSTSINQLKGHLFIDHLIVLSGKITLDRLIYDHSIDHEHPYWSHNPKQGVVLHIHHGSLPGQEPTEWAW